MDCYICELPLNGEEPQNFKGKLCHLDCVNDVIGKHNQHIGNKLYEKIILCERIQPVSVEMV
jgi:hypothetical protein